MSGRCTVIWTVERPLDRERVMPAPVRAGGWPLIVVFVAVVLVLAARARAPADRPLNAEGPPGGGPSIPRE